VPNQKKGGVEAVLNGRRDYICADATGVYDRLFSKPGSLVIEIGCWMHARRYFERALDGGEIRAAVALAHIKRLYKIENRANKRGFSWEKRTLLRQKSRSLLLISCTLGSRIGMPSSLLAPLYPKL
jgi:transposase